MLCSIRIIDFIVLFLKISSDNYQYPIVQMEVLKFAYKPILKLELGLLTLCKLPHNS